MQHTANTTDPRSASPAPIQVQSGRSQGRSAFSLIELLVVISVVAVLASLLLPAVALVKKSAYSVGCLSNLRQQGIAVTCYAQDNGGTVLPLIGGTQHSPWEDMGQLHLLVLGGYIELPGCDNLSDPVTGERSIVRCPAGRTEGLSTTSTGPEDAQSLYPGRWTVVDLPPGTRRYYDSWYTWNACFLTKYSGQYLMCRKATFNTVPNLGTAVFIVDGASSMHPNGQRISARHGGRVNILFGDGHVGAATPAALCTPGTLILANSADYRWFY